MKRIYLFSFLLSILTIAHITAQVTCWVPPTLPIFDEITTKRDNAKLILQKEFNENDVNINKKYYRQEITFACGAKCIAHNSCDCPTCDAKIREEHGQLQQKYEGDLKVIQDEYDSNFKIIADKYCEDQDATEKLETEKKYKTLISEGDKLMSEKKYDEAEAKYSEANSLLPEKSYAKSQMAKAKELKEKQENDKTAKTENTVSVDTSKAKTTTSDYVYTPTKYDLDYQYAQQRQADHQANQASNAAAATALAALYIGFYMYDVPVKDIYESSSSGYFSIGPTNSFIYIPTFVNSDIHIEYANGMESSNKKTELGGIYTGNFGTKIEFGRMYDGFQITIPLKGSIGLFSGSQENISASCGLNLFFGSKKWEKFKFGVSAEYGTFLDDRDDYRVDPFGVGSGFSELTTQAYCNFNIKTIKYGFRIQRHFNSSRFNSTTPFVFDLFFTTSQIDDVTINKGYNYSHSMSPGIELNISKLGVFGFYARIINMAPVGEIEYPNFSVNSIRPGTPFFEVGIKREYSWFRGKKKS